MSDRVLRLYHSLPSGLRSAAATMRGRYLRGWRYGPETNRLVEEALDRESWSRSRWDAWRQERLAFVLHRAATMVPYYREQWAARRQRGDRASWECIENWPILHKEPLRASPRAFVADDCNVRRMYHEHTSGTTGTSLHLWWSRATVRAWYALLEARGRGWYGVSRAMRWANIGGQLVTPVSQRRPPFWVWNGGLNQLYLSSYHLAPDLIPAYLDALVEHRIEYLWGYSSSLFALAQETLRLGRRDVKMIVVISNAEPLFAYQREAIAEAFQCPVRETYGMCEIVANASECQNGRLHVWPEVGWIETLARDGPVSAGAVGELVCTGLLNADMPLIRYRVGDRGALASAVDPACPCGRSLPVLASVEGRMEDVLYTTDGRRIGRLDAVFKKQLPIREAQIIQEALDRVRVKYVPAPDFRPEVMQAVVDRIRARMGPVHVQLEPVAELPRGPNGKFRAIVCSLSAEERARVQTEPDRETIRAVL